MIVLKEIFEEIVTGIKINDSQVNFKYGYWPIIAKELQDESRSKQLQTQRYPLIFLHADIDEKITNAWTININPTFYLIHQTSGNYDVESRLELVYKPYLYRMYVDLIKAIRHSKKFRFDGGEIPHTKKDLFYLQNLAANQNKINSIVDAIEVKISSINLFKDTYKHYEYIVDSITLLADGDYLQDGIFLKDTA